MVTEVTVSNEKGNLIFGLNGQHVLYKINGQKIDSNIWENERIILYSKRCDGGRNPSGGASLNQEEISFIPKMDYYPILCKNNSPPEIPGRIVNIEEKLS